MTHAIPGLGWAKPVFQLGERTLAVPMSLHAAARAKICAGMKDRGIDRGVLLFCGGHAEVRFDSDHEILFRQDSWFNYVFGANESSCYGAIDIASGKATLFIPRLPDDYRVFMGSIHPPEHFKSLYGVEEVLFTDEFLSWLNNTYPAGTSDKHVLYLLQGQNSDSKAFPKSINFKQEIDSTAANEEQTIFQTFQAKYGPECVNMTDLFPVIANARVTKSDYEKQVMWYAAFVSSRAHVEVMRIIHSNMMEYELEAKFLYEVYRNGGCRKSAYTCICGTGVNSAVLHYGHAGAPNDRKLLPGDIALLDMGGEYHGYASDITCSYPVDGKFTDKQRGIYTAVLNAQVGVYNIMKEGVSWVACHEAAERELLKQLCQVGVVIGGDASDTGFIQQLVDLRLGAVFMPHGLGHLIGCDTHDVGGYVEGTPERSTQPGLKNLRTSRCLTAHMLLTVEPGCYFIPYLLEKVFNDSAHPHKPFINEALVREEYMDFGGIRLEDDVYVTPNGGYIENLTTCPRLIEEVESVCNGGVWPPEVDNAPWLHRVWGELETGGSRMKTISSVPINHEAVSPVPL